MRIGNIIEFVINNKTTHTGRVIEIKDNSIIVLDDKTGEEVEILKSDTGLEYL